ncbi:MAG: HAD family hydrolase [Candidatus Rokuibacteriota bacterium]
MSRTVLVSLDIDGTLEVGEPPGIITMAMVRQTQQLGYLIGSCSDRPLGYQRQLWQDLEITADFTVLKHRLIEVKALFSAETYYHIGDTELDDAVAAGAGFRFLRAEATAHQSWWPQLVAASIGTPVQPRPHPTRS